MYVMIALFLLLTTRLLYGYTLDEKIIGTKAFKEKLVDTYQYTETCMRSVTPYKLNVPSLDELYKHYFEILQVTRPFRGIPPHYGNTYGGPWIENYFIDTFSNHSLLEFGGYIPLFVQWLDYTLLLRNTNKKTMSLYDVFRPIFSVLRHDIAYITVSQANEGIPILIEYFPNVLILSAGGNGNIPIPLILKHHDYIEPPLPSSSSSYTASTTNMITTTNSISNMIRVGFYGIIEHGPRKTLMSEFMRYLKSTKLTYQVKPSKYWKANISDTIFNLAPRGYGRASFRLCEIIQLGRIPVYLYNDISWLAYSGTNVSIESIGYVAKSGQFKDLIQTLVTTSENDVYQKFQQVKHARYWYTYEGVMEQIELFFRRPGDRIHSYLSCQHALKAGKKTSMNVLDSMALF